MSRPYTKEEVRHMFLEHCRVLTKYWARVDGPIEEKLEGVAFSILTLIDGSTAELPSFDLVARPHEEDKQYAIDNEENWFEDGLVINDDCHLHDLFYSSETAAPADTTENQPPTS